MDGLRRRPGTSTIREHKVVHRTRRKNQVETLIMCEGEEWTHQNLIVEAKTFSSWCWLPVANRCVLFIPVSIPSRNRLLFRSISILLRALQTQNQTTISSTPKTPSSHPHFSPKSSTATPPGPIRTDRVHTRPRHIQSIPLYRLSRHIRPQPLLGMSDWISSRWRLPKGSRTTRVVVACTRSTSMTCTGSSRMARCTMRYCWNNSGSRRWRWRRI